jgi:phosphoglucosamine mutase
MVGEPVLHPCHGEALDAYRKKWNRFFKTDSLKSLKIVLDCANGALSSYGEEFLSSLGATVIAIGNSPDGTNINAGCGSEHGEFFSQKVVEWGADWGLAVDGDGDRALLCDSEGRLIAGEHLLAQLALAERAAQNLPRAMVVTTIRANLALDAFLETQGIGVVRSDVGDRNVVVEMLKWGCNLGGETSGHIIFSDFGPMADGLFAGTLFLSNIGIRPSIPNWQFPLHAYKEKNFPVARRISLEKLPQFSKQTEEAERALGPKGRVLARYSGTEAKLRLLVEGEDYPTVEQHLALLEEAFRADMGRQS